MPRTAAAAQAAASDDAAGGRDAERTDKGSLDALPTSPWGLLANFRHLNRNVQLVLLYNSIFAFCRGVWMRQVLSALVFERSDSNLLVGSVPAMSGIAEIAVAPVAGYFADKFGRDKLTKFGGVVALVNVPLTIAALLSGSLGFLAVAMGLWGVVNGSVMSPISALFADSVPSGARSGIYALRHAMTMFGSGFGPILDFLVFEADGNEWDIDVVVTVACIGVSCQLIPAFVLFFFDDRKSLGRESESLERGGGIKIADATTDEMDPPRAPEDELSLDSGDDGGSDTRVSIADATTKVEKSSACCRMRCVPFGHAWIPFIIVGTDLFIACGSGMSVQFFPLFLQHEHGMSPSGVSAFYIISPLATAAAGLSAQWLSRKWGRPQVITTFHMTGSLLLLALAFKMPTLLVIPMLIIRTASMNAGSPLKKSILMDHVEKGTRARWESMDSVIRVNWTGSAVLGGLLIDAFDYRTCFAITGTIYVVFTCIEMLLWPLVRREFGTAGGTTKVGYKQLSMTDMVNTPSSDAETEPVSGDDADQVSP